MIADTTATAIHLGERECSIQRRHQKLIEESAPRSSSTRPNGRRSARLAVQAAAKAAGYTQRRHGGVPAGRRRVVLSSWRVNARLQVEHPVTEMVTGLDLVASR